MAEMWYYTTEGKQMDPVTIAELRRLVGDGTLKPTDMVWKDGMPRWIRASSLKELFPDPLSALDKYFTHTSKAGTTTGGVPQAAGATSGGASVGTPGESATQPMRRPSSSANDDADLGPPRRRRDPAKSAGGGSGVVIFLLLGVGVLMLALCGGIGILIFAWPEKAPANNGTPIDGEFKYQVNTFPNGHDERVFNLRRNVQYEITVKSNPNHLGIDIDLFVIHQRSGEQEASDIADGPDCLVRFTPRIEGDYRVEIRNVQGNMNVTSNVTIREVREEQIKDKEKDKGKEAKDDQPPKDKDTKDGGPKEVPLPAGAFEGKGLKNFTVLKTPKAFTMRVKGGHAAVLKVTPLNPTPNSVIHLVVLKDSDPNGPPLFQDRPNGPSPSISFNVPETQIIRVQIFNAGKGSIKGELFYDVSP